MDKGQMIGLIVGVLIVSLVGGAVGARLFGGSSAGSLKVGELRVVDDQGRTRVFMGVDGVSTVMKLYGEGNAYRMFFGADSIGTSMAMYTPGRGIPGMGIYPGGVGVRRHDNPMRIIWTK